MNITDLKELLLRDNSTFGTTFLSVYQVIDLLDKIDEPIEQERIDPIKLLQEVKQKINDSLGDACCNIDASDVIDYSEVSFSISNGNEIEVDSIGLNDWELKDSIQGYLWDAIEELENKYTIKD
jgi:hypothetical protein